MTTEKINYQRLTDEVTEKIDKGAKPSLLLHACCAPCSSYVLEYLSEYFNITLFFYNPNIAPEEEYRFRADELCRLVREMGLSDSVSILEGNYEPERFEALAKGLETLREGGARCERCFRLRLSEAAIAAKNGGFDYFTTTLSISPHKNAVLLNSIGKELSEEYGVPYLFSDFKKKNGYKRSCELSEQFSLYRQNYCGCIYSRNAGDASYFSFEKEK